MPKMIAKLSETQIRNARPRDKDYKLCDEGGLRLLVRKSGSKVWQFPYILNGKANVYTIGKYDPTGRVGFIGTAEARRLRDDVKYQVQQGIDPNRQKKMRRSGGPNETTFEAIAREWHSKQIWAPKHAAAIIRTLEMDAFPHIGNKQITEVKPLDIVDILRNVESRDALDVAKRISQRCEAVFDYAINLGLCENNPATNRSKIIRTRKVKHRPSLTAAQLPGFLSKLESYHGSKVVQLAMKLLLHTFVRPGELRKARWEEFDELKLEWRIPEERMKMRRPHIVPLSSQVLELLAELKPLSQRTGLLFPSAKNYREPISDVTLLKVLKILGYEGENKVVPHGMRSTASTILNESGRFGGDAIERQLAHVPKNKVRASYNHAQYLDERKTMMQWWSEYLQAQKEIGNG